MSGDRDLPTTSATEARMLEIVFPDHTTWARCSAARRWRGGQGRPHRRLARLGTHGGHGRSEQFDLRLPIHQGQRVETVARIDAVGRTSMQVAVEVWAEDLLSGARELCTRGRFSMVALDAAGRPAPLPALPAQPPA